MIFSYFFLGFLIFAYFNLLGYLYVSYLKSMGFELLIFIIINQFI